MTTSGIDVSAEDLIAQFESVFGIPGALDGVGEVDLYNSGSFLSDDEVPAEVREHVLQRLSGSGAHLVLIESRPEFVTEPRLALARQALGAIALEVGIGLESANDRVREVLIHKGFGKAQFEKAVSVLSTSGARLLAYVLLKPMGLDEQAAIVDTMDTARYVFEVARECGVRARVALQPTFVAPKTPLEAEFLAGRYEPPSLWSVVDVVRQVHPLGEILIGLSDEGLEPQRAPAGCWRCTQALRAALVEYNRTHELGVFDTVNCNCRR
jgi:radical SAM enzyme (TIGR01210 family)